MCRECGHELFSSQAKYQHGTPWPAFSQPLHHDSLAKAREDEPQSSSNNTALKLTCGRCGNGLGHEFLKDGPDGEKSRF